MQKSYILSLLVIVASIFIISNIYAQSCVSDINCIGQGQNVCQNKKISGWSCVNNQCEQSNPINVQCCNHGDCAIDQICQDNVCVGGSIDEPIPIDEGSSPSNSTSVDNTLIYVLIIAVAIIIGFIILAKILSKKKN